MNWLSNFVRLFLAQASDENNDQKVVRSSEVSNSWERGYSNPNPKVAWHGHGYGYPTNAQLLLYIREQTKTDLKSLLGHFGFSHLGLSRQEAIRRSLRELYVAKLISLKEEFVYTERNFEIEMTSVWGDMQQTLGISLTEIASARGDSVYVSPVFGLPRKLKEIERSDIFVLMPFVSEMKSVFDIHIRKVAHEIKLTVKRGDDFFTAESIIDDIWAAIAGCRIVIADCTGRNPNVFYEIGMAHTLGKPVILITQDVEDIPFDLRHMRYFIYQKTPQGMADFERILMEAIRTVLETE